ncbi:hypothetical protein [Nitrosomonas sp. Is37]|uniref:hypothetical protein n=1 Tax=Nitrosomonas sp. Is37 TaxID=3080535 RepID=UPI00294AD1CA|nr:hypothetical protein [Nitrosomonas sp. Is37]MDV6344316.1 hypothetical protein [Nitrosomonas sp. Is37]
MDTIAIFVRLTAYVRGLSRNQEELLGVKITTGNVDDRNVRTSWNSGTPFGMKTAPAYIRQYR